MFGSFDWNGNGVHDFFDDLMTLQLINRELDEEEEDNEDDEELGRR